jgi:hypothetical protein
LGTPLACNAQHAGEAILGEKGDVAAHDAEGCSGSDGARRQILKHIRRGLAVCVTGAEVIWHAASMQ